MNGIEDSSILVVDDTEANIDVLLDALDEMYEVRVALDGPTALEQCRASPPDLILLDIMMPGMDGFEVFRRLQQEDGLNEVPVIFVTALNDPVDERKGLELGAVDYITKPFNPSVVQARVRNHLELKTAKALLKDENSLLEYKVLERTRQLQQTQDVTIECLASLAETRDPETGNHIRRTQHYVKLLAEQLQNNPKFVNLVDDNYIQLLFKSTEKTFRIITEGDGRVMPFHFDPDVLQAFHVQAERFRKIAVKYSD